MLDKAEKGTIIYTDKYTYGVLVKGWKGERAIDTICKKYNLGSCIDYLTVDKNTGLVSHSFITLQQHKQGKNNLV